MNMDNPYIIADNGSPESIEFFNDKLWHLTENDLDNIGKTYINDKRLEII